MIRQTENRDVFLPHDCDLCGSSDAAEIEVTRHYTHGEPLHVCRNCGFVYARMRRSAERIADAWSDEIYASSYEYSKSYTARIPAMKARQTYVVDFADVSLGLKDKRLIDIGAGEGLFLDMARKPPYEAKVYGVEPSAGNCKLMADMGIDSFCGTAESFQASAEARTLRFDVATSMWTLAACYSPGALLQCAWDALDDGGHVVIGEGSRILVPFRKPLQYFLKQGIQDTHPFYFSANALQGFLATNGFEVTHVNRFIDTDHLVVIGRKVGKDRKLSWQKDDWRAVVDFFERWHRETQSFYANA